MLFPTLEHADVRLQPLNPEDEAALYLVASDPNIWVQHPDKERYTRQGFAAYLTKLRSCNAAYLIIDTKTAAIIGATSYYLYDPDSNEIAVGYTFLAKSHWNTGYNAKVKQLMLQHAFGYVDTVIFHVHQDNIRSKIALQKIGALLRRSFTVQNNGLLEQKLEFVVTRADYRERIQMP